jgi:hypothetical protein
MKGVRALTAILVGMFVLARVAGAQQRPAMGISVETALPASQLSQAFNAGLGVELFGKKSIHDGPLAARVGLGYRSFFAETTWHLQVISLEAAGEYTFRGLPFSPYLRAGAGVYSTAEKATVPGGVNGVFHDRMDRRSENPGGMFGFGFDIPAGRFHIPIGYSYHRIAGVRVQGGPVAFNSLSIGIEF